MKKTKLINSKVSALIADLGHTDLICLADAGLPVPKGVEKIDLAVHLGLPEFLDVLKTIASESVFEEAYMSEDVMEHFPKLPDQIKEILGGKIKITLIKHTSFKDMTKDTKAIIRTGEDKWFHNVILKSGVSF